MTSRPSRLVSAVRAALVVAVACVATLGGAAAAQGAILQADFHFNNTRAAPTGQVMSDIGLGNAFALESVDGGLARPVLTFPAGNGLSLPTAGLAPSGSYSVVMLFRLDPAASRRKLLDFTGGTADAGLYLCDGELLLESLAATPCPGGTGLPDESFVQVVLTRDGGTGQVLGYLDGVEQVSGAPTPGPVMLGPEVRFFMDDDVPPANEHAAGAVARIRIYDGVLSMDELNSLGRVDLDPPDTTIDSAPPPLSSDMTPTFAFSSPDSGARFECRHHGVADPVPGFGACPPSGTLDTLADGTYVFAVRAIDAAGNPDNSPASQTFTVDATAPDTSIASGPAGPTNDATPEFAFAGTEAGSFECRYHPIGDAPPAFAPCSSPHSLGPLADAGYVFEVAATDAAGNRDGSAATRTFTVDTTAPATEITGGPGDTTSAIAVFLFSAPGAAGFSCRLDDGAWRPCSSPESYTGLSPGRHHFEVRAVDEAGNEDATPATHDWQVLRPGLVIPGTLQQATALARELVQMRRALSKIRLRTLGRRRAVTLRGFDALTGGTVEVRVTDRLRRKRGRRRVTLLRGKREIPRAGRYPVRARVTTKGRNLARRRRTTLPVELRLSFTDLAGRSLWATAKLALRP
jgi:Concanavalin A-like lectin/glucanases superfamily